MGLNKLQKKININFSDSSLLKEALTHSSYLNENKDKDLKDNERLEFLGDSVLEIVISEIIFKKFPSKTEGELTLIRSNLVNKKTLSKVSKKLTLNEFIILGKGEEKNNARESEKFSANVLEAIIGAIFLDIGFETAKKFIVENFASLIADIESKRLHDYKTMLQEVFQKEHKKDPKYLVIEVEDFFEASVLMDEKEIGKGQGKSKKEAQQMAAEIALKKLKS